MVEVKKTTMPEFQALVVKECTIDVAPNIASIRSNYRKGRSKIYGAYIDNNVVGVASVRNDVLEWLLVAREWRRSHVAKTLLDGVTHSSSVFVEHSQLDRMFELLPKSQRVKGGFVYG